MTHDNGYGFQAHMHDEVASPIDDGIHEGNEPSSV